MRIYEFMRMLRIANHASRLMVRNSFRKHGLVILFIAAALAVSYAIVARAQTVLPDEPSEEQVAARGITFPIPELGNCGSKDGCRTYCNDPENIPACVKFAKEHGLMNKEEAEKAEKFSGRLRSGAGPGGCNSPDSCESFCSDLKNIEVCIKFAEGQGLQDDHVREGKKILNYLKSGGEFPGGCTSRDACEAYCRDFDHAEECFAFAEKAGIGPASPPGQFGREGRGPRPEDIKRFIELAKKGETPGGCKTKEECESYCRDQSHFEECVEFGVKAGFVDRDQAEKFRRFGGRGPGECRGEEECRAYCNDPSHREECFRFAEENGLIPKEDLEKAKEGMVRLRAGIGNAPPEVSECLRSVLGTNVIEDIQLGNLLPGREIGERMRACFERFGASHEPQRLFQDAPPQVVSCLKEKLGDTFERVRSGGVSPTPEMADAFRVCFEGFRPSGEGGPRFGSPEGGSGSRGGLMPSFPSPVLNCFKEKLGDDFEVIMREGMMSNSEFREKVKECFGSVRPGSEGAGGGGGGGFFRGEQGGNGGSGLPEHPGFSPPAGFTNPLERFPQAVSTCLKSSLSEEQIRSLASGITVAPGISEAIKRCFRNFASPPGENLPIYTPTPSIEPVAPAPTGDGCYDRTSCEKVCSDTASSYYNSDNCVKFRTQIQSNVGVRNLLGIIIAPFINLLR